MRLMYRRLSSLRGFATVTLSKIRRLDSLRYAIAMAEGL